MEVRKMTTKLKISGVWDGNIFAVIGNTLKYLKAAGRKDLAEEVSKNFAKQGDYYATLGYCIQKLEEAGYEVE
jgi:hypothetical protein